MLAGDGDRTRTTPKSAASRTRPTRSPARPCMAIHRTFVTPFDRSQILDLITALDDTIDLMKEAGRRMPPLRHRFTPQMLGMAECACAPPSKSATPCRCSARRRPASPRLTRDAEEGARRSRTRPTTCWIRAARAVRGRRLGRPEADGGEGLRHDRGRRGPLRGRRRRHRGHRGRTGLGAPAMASLHRRRPRLIGLALLFDFLNGLHDSANSIATVVSTRVLRPSPPWPGRRSSTSSPSCCSACMSPATIGTRRGGRRRGRSRWWSSARWPAPSSGTC